MDKLIAAVVVMLMWPFAAMWRAYVLLVLWAWFVTPATNYPVPSIYLAVGFMMVLHLALPINTHEHKDNEISDVVSRSIAYGFVYPAVALGCAWIWKWLQWGLT